MYMICLVIYLVQSKYSIIGDGDHGYDDIIGTEISLPG